MRVSLAKGAVVAVVFSSLAGCSNPSTSQFLKSFSMRSKKPAPAASSIANAPAAPSFNSATAAVPSVTMPSASPTSANLPVYPGTTYPVTPYPASTMPANVAANPYTGYAPDAAAGGTPAAQPVAPTANSYATNPYAAAPQANPYAPQTPAYNPVVPPAAPYNTAEQPGSVTR